MPTRSARFALWVFVCLCAVGMSMGAHGGGPNVDPGDVDDATTQGGGSATEAENTPLPNQDPTVTQTDFYVEMSFEARGQGFGETTRNEWKRIVSQATSTPARRTQIDKLRFPGGRRQASWVSVSATLFTLTEQGALNKQEVIEASDSDFIFAKLDEAVADVLDGELQEVSEIEAVAKKVGAIEEAPTDEGSTPAPAGNGLGFNPVYLSAIAALLVPFIIFVYFQYKKSKAQPTSASSWGRPSAEVPPSFASNPPPINPSLGQPSAPPFAKEDSVARPSAPPAPPSMHSQFGYAPDAATPPSGYRGMQPMGMWQ
mmetsp:Transcript_19422/g.48688  ORF Transcript_19422/g.48688 Transcript_19422/m.48688 type:complete len:314 (-) Transcript_19422:358-1299(-)